MGVNKKKMFGSGGGVIPYPITNLIAYYRFDNDATDEKGSHDGTEVTMLYGTGKSGQSADFGGAGGNDEIYLDDHNDFSFTDGAGNDEAFSISFYVKFDDTGNQWFINKRENTSTEVEWQLFYFGNDLYLQCSNSTNSTNIKGLVDTWIPNTGQWYHLVFTYDGSEVNTGFEIYIEGVKQTLVRSSVGSYAGMTNGSSRVDIGKAGWSQTLSFNGEMDGLGIWDIELNQTEVTNIYNKQNSGQELI